MPPPISTPIALRPLSVPFRQEPVLLVSLTDVDRYGVCRSSLPPMLRATASQLPERAVPYEAAGSRLMPSIDIPTRCANPAWFSWSDLPPTLFSWLGIQDAPGVSGTLVTHDELLQTCTVTDDCFSARLDDLSDRATHASAMRMRLAESSFSI